MSRAMLAVNHLSCGYETFKIKNVSFSVESGEFTGIIGPNGSGKTTLLRAITGILKPESGTIFLGGKDIAEMDVKELARKIAVVSQSSEIPHITVEEYVLLGRTPHQKRFQFMETRNDVEVCEKCMKLTETLPFRNKSIDQLSGGERQLVLIARALAQEPELILLDEPTTFLDITHQVRIMDLIKRLNLQKGLTVLTVLHDLNLAGEYCSDLVLMKEGELYKKGVPGDVLTYQTIEAVYETLVVVGKSPVSSRPYIFVVTEEEERMRGGSSVGQIQQKA